MTTVAERYGTTWPPPIGAKVRVTIRCPHWLQDEFTTRWTGEPITCNASICAEGCQPTFTARWTEPITAT